MIVFTTVFVLYDKSRESSKEFDNGILIDT